MKFYIMLNPEKQALALYNESMFPLFAKDFSVCITGNFKDPFLYQFNKVIHENMELKTTLNHYIKLVHLLRY